MQVRERQATGSGAFDPTPFWQDMVGGGQTRQDGAPRKKINPVRTRLPRCISPIADRIARLPGSGIHPIGFRLGVRRIHGQVFHHPMQAIPRFLLLVTVALLAGCTTSDVIMTGDTHPAVSPDKVTTKQQPRLQSPIAGSESCSLHSYSQLPLVDAARKAHALVASLLATSHDGCALCAKGHERTVRCLDQLDQVH